MGQAIAAVSLVTAWSDSRLYVPAGRDAHSLGSPADPLVARLQPVGMGNGGDPARCPLCR